MARKKNGIAAYQAALKRIKSEHGCSHAEAKAIFTRTRNGDDPAPAGLQFTQEHLSMQPGLVKQLVAFNVTRLDKIIKDAQAEKAEWQKMATADEQDESPRSVAAREFAGAGRH